MTSAPSASAIAIERARRRFFCVSVRTMVVRFSSMASPSASRGGPAKQAAEFALDQKQGKESEKVEDRIGEHFARCSFSGTLLASGKNTPGEGNHPDAEKERSDAVDRAS